MSTTLEPAKSVNASHLRMARAGLNLTVRELANLAGVNKATIVRIEADVPVRESSLNSVRSALEARGAQFVICHNTLDVFVSL
ncbi:MAG: transcriptional regulator [Pseudomonadota bacterium]